MGEALVAHKVNPPALSVPALFQRHGLGVRHQRIRRPVEQGDRARVRLAMQRRDRTGHVLPQKQWPNELSDPPVHLREVVHPEDPDHFIHWKLRQLREKLEKSMITLMKSKRKNKGLSDANIVWLKYLQRKVAMVNEYIKKYSLKGKKGDSME